MAARRKPKPIRVIQRKLGREGAWGQAIHEDRLIEMEPRQSDDRYLTILVHELLHVVFPHLTEKEVLAKSEEMGEVIWKEGYRRSHSPKGPDRE